MKNIFQLVIRPRETMRWSKFLNATPARSIALDGIVTGGPRFQEKTLHINFDHHDGVVREATMSTCMQMYVAIKGGLMESFRQPYVFINDTDQDTALAVWLIENYKLFEGTQSIPHINRLVALTNNWDITGGAFPMNLSDDLIEQHGWIFEPYTKLRTSGQLAVADESVLKSNIEAILGRLDKFLMNEGGRKPLDTRHEILYDSPLFKVVDEIGGNDARYYLYAKGMNAFLSIVARRNDGRFVYSIGRRSQYIPFPLKKLYEDFNAAEGLSGEDRWGGSTTIGGSPRFLGSGLEWQQIIEIINKRHKKEKP